jgi:hypothetical protein
MTKLFTHQCTRTFPCLPPFPSFKAFSIQRPVRSNSPSKFSSSVSSTSMDICSYFSELGIATLSFRTDSTCVIPASWSAPLRLRVKTLRCIYVSEDIQMRRRCKWGGLTYPPMKSSSSPGTRVSDMVIGEVCNPGLKRGLSYFFLGSSFFVARRALVSLTSTTLNIKSLSWRQVQGVKVMVCNQRRCELRRLERPGGCQVHAKVNYLESTVLLICVTSVMSLSQVPR